MKVNENIFQEKEEKKELKHLSCNVHYEVNIQCTRELQQWHWCRADSHPY